jgi:hypothetical protein
VSVLSLQVIEPIAMRLLGNQKRVYKIAIFLIIGETSLGRHTRAVTSHVIFLAKNASFAAGSARTHDLRLHVFMP